VLEEVVGAQIVTVTGDPAIVNVTAAQPPGAIELSGLFDLRVNANGEAEWVIADPAGARGGVIPTKGGR
jgi:hypothetical protein